MRTAAWLVGLGWAACAAAQTFGPPPQGRPFDASGRFGNYGGNFLRPISPLQAGNLTATGNIRGGLSLRSFSPISDPTEFRGALGSASLSNFLRDSVSVSDRFLVDEGYAPVTPFYDPTRTAPTSGFLTGQTAVRPFVAPRGRGAQPGLLNYGAAGAEASEYLPPMMSSSLYGVTTPTGPRLPKLYDPMRPEIGTALDAATERRSGTLSALQRTTTTAGGATIGDSRLSSGTLGHLLSGDSQALLSGERGRGAPVSPGSGPPPAAEAGKPAQEQAVLSTDELTQLYEQDPLGAMRSTVALQEQMQTLERRDASPGEGIRAGVRSAAEAAQTLQAVRQLPIRTFVSQKPDQVNEELAAAESLLRGGDHYAAARRYETAIAYDRSNPLAYVGKGHALLAAGEYLSAAVLLQQAFERMPQLPEFNVDLPALMGGPQMVDLRRAAIAELLSRGEEAQLRFLLGYIEWYSGMRDRGLENLRKAAEQADPGSAIQRFYRMAAGSTAESARE